MPGDSVPQGISDHICGEVTGSKSAGMDLALRFCGQAGPGQAWVHRRGQPGHFWAPGICLFPGLQATPHSRKESASSQNKAIMSTLQTHKAAHGHVGTLAPSTPNSLAAFSLYFCGFQT